MTTPNSLDWSIVLIFFAIILGIGLWVSRRAGRSSQEFFLSGRNLPWWMLGLSMVATTFATDTPNLVTDIVRRNGVAGNWEWWAFLLTGMLTVFVYARLWRRSGVQTDMEFYELRYGGKPARFLRAFRAVYLGLLFNILAMSAVTLAAIKIGEILFGIAPWTTILIAAGGTLLFSTLGGFRGVIYTDFLLFFVAIAGAVAAAVFALDLPEVGGLKGLLQHPGVADKLRLVPDVEGAFRNGGSQLQYVLAIFIIPLSVQWWNSWYPGAEPGGGGYIAQRMLAARNEEHAIRATFFFNILHYALRPWPWILVALASLIVFPDLEQLQAAFPELSDDKLGHDAAYPAMLTFLPHGWMGLVLASLMAAYISTISTHLNWGASYLVNDVYKRFVHPEASERRLVLVGRIATALLLLLSALAARYMQTAKQVFDVILMFGAGTGLLFLLRWFWWRINAWAEIAAMLISGTVSVLFAFGGWYPDNWAIWARLPLVALITTLGWLTVMWATPAEKKEVLLSFVQHIRPGGPGWKRFTPQVSGQPKGPWKVPLGLLCMFVGTALVYSCLFAAGYWLYGEYEWAMGLTVLALVLAVTLQRFWKKGGGIL